MDVDGQVEVGMGRVLAGQLHQQALASIKAAVREEVLDEVHEAAVQQARDEMEDEFSRRREKLLDDLARQRRQLQEELESELDRREEQLRQDVRDGYDERLLTLKDDLAAAAAARDQATTLLVSLVQQMCERKRYLHDAGVKELDLVGLNDVLALKGLRLRGEFRHSERQVVCKLKAGAGQRTTFWLERLPRAGVVDADDQDGGAPG
jgi:hypothetical protein